VLHFTIGRSGEGLRVAVARAPGVDAAALARRLEAGVRAALAPFGLAGLAIEVAVADEVERPVTVTGKRRRVTGEEP
jgi:hypothetical protein